MILPSDDYLSFLDEHGVPVDQAADASQAAIYQHNNVETPLFAKSIERKVLAAARRRRRRLRKFPATDTGVEDVLEQATRQTHRLTRWRIGPEHLQKTTRDAVPRSANPLCRWQFETN